MRKKQTKNGNSFEGNDTLSAEDREELERGVHYFNDKNFERAHEAWELLSERKTAIDKKYLQGMMHLATSVNGVMRNGVSKGETLKLQKVYENLISFPPDYFGIGMGAVLQFLERFTSHDNGKKTDREIRIPQIVFHKPLSPDICAAVTDVLRSDRFIEGITLFNKALYWEAHEVWEDLWRDQTVEGKEFVDSFMKISEAYTFARRGKMSSAIYLFEKALKQFGEYQSHNCEISAVQIISEIERDLNLVRRSIAENAMQVKFPKRPLLEYTQMKEL
jgi:predicted metal-dependent hydrolase